jgi:ABC-type dipeptide/oligopeptide/nickel transport system ATPase component
MQLQRERNMAILYTTHDLHEAAAIASRIMILVSGRIATELPGQTAPAAIEQELLAAVGR